jgi:transcriptional regulator with XRE-family HTH domain
MMSIDVGERLRFVRSRNKLSQRELAKRSGVTNSTISLIESNQMNPSVGALKRILDGIPMGLAEFFALEPDRPRKAFYRSDELSEIGKGPISFRQVGDNLFGRALQILKERYDPGGDIPVAQPRDRGCWLGLLDSPAMAAAGCRDYRSDGLARVRRNGFVPCAWRGNAARGTRFDVRGHRPCFGSPVAPRPQHRQLMLSWSSVREALYVYTPSSLNCVFVHRACGRMATSSLVKQGNRTRVGQLRVIWTYESWGYGSTLKAKSQQSIEIAGFSLSILVAGRRNRYRHSLMVDI